MFIEEVYQVAWSKKDKIEYKGKSYEVSPIVFRECKLITKIHSLLIGVAVVFSVFLSEYLYVQSFFALLLLIAIVLGLLSVLINYLSKFLIMRRMTKNV